MKTSKKSKSKQNKQEILAGRIERAAKIIRTLPDTLNPQAQFEDESEPHKLPYKPTEWWLLNAGAHVRGAMRLGCFKDYENMLLLAGEEKFLWKELIRILRKRSGLPYPRDYLRDFADDCRLVADELEQESNNVFIDFYLDDITTGTWQAEAIKLLWEHRDWSITKIAKMVNKTPQAFYNDGKGKGLGGKNEGISGAIEGRNDQKKAGKPIPAGEIDTRTNRVETMG